MTQIGRSGWENENLARFILSRISFVAQPVSVSDDVGTDFFCTLFESQTNSHRAIPKNSFAIQIKSNRRSFEVTEKRAYLDGLELPFFVGVIDRRSLTINIFSGEYFPVFLTSANVPDKLRLYMVDSVDDLAGYIEHQGKKVVGVRCPHVCTIGAQFTRRQCHKARDLLVQTCSDVHANLATRRSGETIYEFPRVGESLILAGSGSAAVFRRNFLRRLAEAVYNLEWLLSHGRSPILEAEAAFFLDLCERLGSSGRPHPFLAERAQELRRTLEAEVRPRVKTGAGLHYREE